jgi:hypothetical protein
MALDRQAESGQEVLYQIGDGDRLRLDRDPARRNHDGEAFHEGADHVEGEASRADDDGRPEFEGLHAAGAQDLADFLPALQVGGEPAAIPQPSQVDEALDAGVSGGLQNGAPPGGPPRQRLPLSPWNE